MLKLRAAGEVGVDSALAPVQETIAEMRLPRDQCDIEGTPLGKMFTLHFSGASQLAAARSSKSH